MRLPFWGFDPIPRVWGHSVGREEAFLILFSFLPQVDHQKRDSTAESWGGATGQPELWLTLGLKNMASPICGLLVQTLRGLP